MGDVYRQSDLQEKWIAVGGDSKFNKVSRLNLKKYYQRPSISRARMETEQRRPALRIKETVVGVAKKKIDN